MKRLSALLLIFLLLITNLEYVAACSCGEISVKDAVESSDIVFQGIVLTKITTSELSPYGVKLVGDPNSSSYTAILAKSQVAVVRILVSKIYKGRSFSDTISVITAATRGSCGVSFQIGAKYIIYGTTNEYSLERNSFRRSSTNKQTYWTHLCSRTSYYYKSESRAIKNL